MCSSSSIIMPADFEMLVSHSPPIFSSYLADYSPARFSPRLTRATCRSASTNSFLLPPKSSSMSFPPSTPKRPCLVIRPDDSNNSSGDEGCTSPTRLKKKVVFADDRGMSLTHVRVMTEPSNVPPLLNSRFLAEVTQGLSADPISRSEPWEITFPQPASDYVEFRRKLDSEKVSLENVIVKESEEILIGTIKVKNIAFEKQVFVRSSSDQWKTSEDHYCTFVSSMSPNSINAAYVVYDTFSFKLPLPPKSRRLEFCVCFQCDSREFWDSNKCNNYVIVKKMFHETMKGLTINEHAPPQKISAKPNDVSCTKVHAWAQFASWNDLDNSNPYW